MKRVAGFVELFTQKVPAVRAGHKKSTLTDPESIYTDFYCSILATFTIYYQCLLNIIIFFMQ